MDGNIGQDKTTSDGITFDCYPGEPESTNVKSMVIRFRNT